MKNTPSSSPRAKTSAGADALAAAADLALAGTPRNIDGPSVPSTAADPTGAITKEKEGELTRATITLREDDIAALDHIEDYLRGHDRRMRLPRALLVQIAIRSVEVGPALLEIARTVRAQDARGKKKVVAS